MTAPHGPTEASGDSASGVAADYDRVAVEYASRLFNELDGKPFDQELLDRFAAMTSGRLLCDVGCGPGHVARYLSDRCSEVIGIDLSPGMVEVARRLSPGIEFRVGDVRSLAIDDDAFGAVVAFYSLIHLEAGGLPAALGELRRVLDPAGLLLIAVHEGDEVRRPQQMWGIAVELAFTFFTEEQIVDALTEAGFVIEELHRRAPYVGVETPTQRLYVLAKPNDRP